METLLRHVQQQPPLRPIVAKKKLCLVCSDVAKEPKRLEKMPHIIKAIRYYLRVDLTKGIICRNCQRQIETIDSKVLNLKKKCEKSGVAKPYIPKSPQSLPSTKSSVSRVKSSGTSAGKSTVSLTVQKDKKTKHAESSSKSSIPQIQKETNALFAECRSRLTFLTELMCAMRTFVSSPLNQKHTDVGKLLKLVNKEFAQTSYRVAVCQVIVSSKVEPSAPKAEHPSHHEDNTTPKDAPPELETTQSPTASDLKSTHQLDSKEDIQEELASSEIQDGLDASVVTEVEMEYEISSLEALEDKPMQDET